MSELDRTADIQRPSSVWLSAPEANFIAAQLRNVRVQYLLSANKCGAGEDGVDRLKDQFVYEAAECLRIAQLLEDFTQWFIKNEFSY